MLLVPAVVNAQTTYKEAYERSQVAIRKLIPLADELNVTLALEEVWNKFLLSPLEFARYIDEYDSPPIRAYFDVGNVVLYGYPQDWIRTLGKRIVKLHIKDFSFTPEPGTDNSVAAWVSLGEGDIDWTAVYEALRDIGYQGTATLELDPGDAAYSERDAPAVWTDPHRGDAEEGLRVCLRTLLLSFGFCINQGTTSVGP